MDMLKVLLIDDEPFIVQGLAVLIDWSREGFEIAATAANGREALEYLQDHKVDLIIADIKMPVMGGLELLDVIRSEKVSEAYFVILSGYSDFAFARQAIQQNCMDYVLKPVERGTDCYSAQGSTAVRRRPDGRTEPEEDGTGLSGKECFGDAVWKA